jgi:hypothetical protein
MNWLPPKDEHIIYEALSAIADKRFEMIGDSKARCTSTSKGKFYEIELIGNAIMSNDNMAYYRGEISYPMVAMFLEKDMYPFDREILNHLIGIRWKDINQKNKNDYMKSVGEVLAKLSNQGVDTEHIKSEVSKIFVELIDTTFTYLGERKTPSNAY